MTDRLADVRARVRGFLDTRAAMGGPIDHSIVHSVQRLGELHELTTADLETLVEATGAPAPVAPSTGGMGTLTPSVVSPYDQALRQVRAAVDDAVRLEVRPVDLFRTVLAALRGYSLTGHREQIEAETFAAIAAEAPSPLEGMILQPHQAYADRGNYAVLSVTRNDDHTVDVQVVP